VNRQRPNRSNSATLRRSATSAPVRPRMPKFHLQELSRKDLVSSLTLWLVIEVVSFCFLPVLMQMNLGDRLHTWFLTSIPLGIGGVLLMGASSRFVGEIRESSYEGSKALVATLGQAASVLALIGILYPFLMVAGAFFDKAFK
jgi:hypothetical protein